MEFRVVTTSLLHSQSRPFARTFLKRRRQCPGHERFMVEHENRGGRLRLFAGSLFDFIDERGQADDGIVLEQERRDGDFASRRTQQVAKGRANAVGATPFGRPPKLPQNGRRIEDVPARPLGPCRAASW